MNNRRLKEDVQSEQHKKIPSSRPQDNDKEIKFISLISHA